MSTTRILVARRNESGAFVKVSESGRVFGTEAAHPQVEGMSEAAHAAICRAAGWMNTETVRPNFVDLSEGGNWRVSLY